MKKVYPEPLPLSPPRFASISMTAAREVFTLSMKSLVPNGNGCTIYDSAGQLAYRVDNYDCKCSDVVFLMDQHGRTVGNIHVEELRVAGRFEGYRCHDDLEGKKKRPWLRMKRGYEFLKRINKSCEIWVTISDSEECYKTIGLGNKLGFKIKDLAGRVVAEVERKKTETGLVLGEDVLMMVVEANTMRLLVIGVMVVCGLIKQNM